MEPEQKIRTIHDMVENIMSKSRITDINIATEIARRWAKT